MPHLSRRAICFTCASLVVTGGAARANSGQTSKPAPPPSAVTAGALLSLSGENALTGNECLRGIQLAVDAINTAGGIAGAPLKLATADAFDQNQAQSIVQSLITSSHAGMILGSGASALSYSGSAAAEIAQIPYLELTAPADGITTRGFKYLLRTGPTAAMIANTATGAINDKFKSKKIGVLFNTGATAGSIAAAALAALNQAKTPPLLAIGYPPDTVDLHGPAGRLKRAGVDVLLHVADPDDVLMFFQAIQELGWQPAATIGCGDGYELRETAFAVGAAFDNTIVAAAPFYPPRAAYVASAYQTRFGMAPRSAESLTAFVGAKLVFDTLNNVHGDVSKMLNALQKTDIPLGILANGFGTSFDKSGQNTRSFTTLQQWRKQQLVPFG